MKNTIGKVFSGVVALLILGMGAQAQEEEEDNPRRSPTPPVTRYAYNATDDPLKMLEEIASANEELLKKQEACLAALGQLEEKAKAARLSAASSARKK